MSPAEIQRGFFISYLFEFRHHTSIKNSNFVRKFASTIKIWVPKYQFENQLISLTTHQISIGKINLIQGNLCADLF